MYRDRIFLEDYKKALEWPLWPIDGIHNCFPFGTDDIMDEALEKGESRPFIKKWDMNNRNSFWGAMLNI